VMLCAFQGPPRILRLHGRGEVLTAGAEFERLCGRFHREGIPGADHASRSLVRVAVERIADSCGFDVPLLDYQGRRPQRTAWVENKLAAGGVGALADYVATRNAESIDALPGL
jgi:hypothetical protein